MTSTDHQHAPAVPAAPLDVRAVASHFHASDAAWQAGLVAAFGRRASDARYSADGQGEPGTALRTLYVARYAAYTAWCEANALPAMTCPVAMVAQPVQQAQARAWSAFDYSPWRHGGWYVNNVRYPNGAIGCVSRNYEDGKWRIVCDPRPNAHQLHTYRTRDEAARAELALVATLPARG